MSIIYKVECWEHREVRVTYDIEASSETAAFDKLHENKLLPGGRVTLVTDIIRRGGMGISIKETPQAG